MVDRIDGVDWRGTGLLAILGRGRDGLLEHVVRDRPLVRRIVLMDPDPAAAQGLPKEVGPQRLATVCGPAGPGMTTALHDLFVQVPWLRYLQTLQVASPPAAEGPPVEWTREALRGLKAASLGAAAHYGNDPVDALDGLSNLLSNLSVIRRSGDIRPLMGAFAGRPAVVASAGPSLSLAFQGLREHMDRVLIVAPDTSLKPLLAAGIRPHIVTSKERSPRTVRLLEGVDGAGTSLMALPLLDPRAFEVWTGDVVGVFGGAAHFPWLSSIGLSRGVLPFEGSSGNMAFRVCEVLGCDPIILVGQDLSFSTSGASHVSGSDNAEAQAIHGRQRRIRVPGNAGDPVWSTPLWADFIRVYEADLRRFSGRCLNATSGGALIRGASPVALDAAFALVGEPFDAHAILAKHRSPPASGGSLSVGVSRSLAAAEGVARRCEEGAATAAALAAEPPDVGPGPWDMDLLLAGPLSAIARQRSAVVRRELFHELLTPVAQSTVIQAEMRLYALARTMRDPGELAMAAAAGWEDWFRAVGGIAQAIAGVLKTQVSGVLGTSPTRE